MLYYWKMFYVWAELKNVCFYRKHYRKVPNSEIYWHVKILLRWSFCKFGMALFYINTQNPNFQSISKTLWKINIFIIFQVGHFIYNLLFVCSHENHTTVYVSKNFLFWKIIGTEYIWDLFSFLSKLLIQ